jgi:hypothetical protein
MQIPNDFAGAVEWRKSALAIGFQRVRYGSITIPTYPTGQIGMLLCEKSVKSKDPPNDVDRRFRIMTASGLTTSYYHPALQRRSVESFRLALYWLHLVYFNASQFHILCNQLL